MKASNALFTKGAGLKRKQYEERLTALGLYSPQQRRLRGDPIETFKILTGKERVNSQSFFQLAILTVQNSTRNIRLQFDINQLDCKDINFNIFVS